MRPALRTTAFATALAAAGLSSLSWSVAAAGAVVPLGPPQPVGSIPVGRLFAGSGVVGLARSSAGRIAMVWATENAVSADRVLDVRTFDAQGNAVAQATVPDEALASDPAVAIDDAGGFVVAWERGGVSGYEVVAQKFSADGSAIGSLLQVGDVAVPNGGLVNNQLSTKLQASVAMDADGDFVVAWNADTLSEKTDGVSHLPPSWDCGYNHLICFYKDTLQYKTYVRAYGADGAPRGDATLVYQSEPFTLRHLTIYSPARPLAPRAAPGVAIDDAGDFVVSLDAPLARQDEIYAVRFNADGTGSQQTLVDSFPLRSWSGTVGSAGTHVAMDASGDFAVLWGHFETHASGLPGPTPAPAPSTLYAQRYSAAGTPLPTPISIPDTRTISRNFDHAAGIAMTAQGDMCITWPGAEESTVNGQFYSADGHAEGQPLSVPVEPGVATAMDRSGELAVAWPARSTSDANIAYDLLLQLFTAP
jgi:hypothetical protein